jgi:hypothetical protein
MPTHSRLSTPALAGAAIAIGLLVVGAILLLGQLGAPGATGAPSVTVAASASPTANSTAASATPEAAVRAFFAAYADARRTGDVTPVADLVTGPESSAYLSVEGFIEGQRAAEKASIVTVQELDNVQATVDGASATVTLELTEGGYDIRLADASPLESAQILAPSKVTVQLVLVDGRWLVESFEAAS